MTLDAYLSTHDLSNEAFGKECSPEASRMRVHAWRTGKNLPSAEYIAAIETATDGAVTAQDWIPPRRKRNSKRAA